MNVNNNYTRTYFIIGLLIGLLIGIYASMKYIERNQKSQFIPITIQSITDTVDNKVLKKSKPKKKKTTKSKHNTKRKIEKDSLFNISDSTNLQKKDSTNRIDSSTIVSSSTDSLAVSNADDSIDSMQYEVINIGETNSDEIKIEKDELIYAIYIRPQGDRNNFLCNSNTKRDSILINNITSRKDDGIYVEFWRSPVNYTGYKLSHNTLVLYGIYQYTSINLKYLPNGILELRYLDNLFNLKCTDDFVSLNLNYK